MSNNEHKTGAGAERNNQQGRTMELAKLARMSLEELLYYVIVELKHHTPSATQQA